MNEGSTLRIYAEERSTPELYAFGADGHAAIGGSDGVSAGTVIARGVNLTASVEGDGAAIGVGIDGGRVAEVSILDNAAVEASSEGNSVAIGGMLNRNDARITLYDNARVDAGSHMTSASRSRRTTAPSPWRPRCWPT